MKRGHPAGGYQLRQQYSPRQGVSGQLEKLNEPRYTLVDQRIGISPQP